MYCFIFALVFAALSCSIAQNPCDTTTNVCALGGYFTTQRGYQCIVKDSATALCTCPGGIEENRPCRLCNRTNPAENVCRNTNGRLLICLETDDYGTSYACLCSDGAGNAIPTTDADCDTTRPLTSTTTTTATTTTGPSSNCLNGGIYVDGICHCPSGYSGPLCADKNDVNLCERIICKNDGVCGIRNYNGPYEGVCLCRYGTHGEYCELNGTLGYCSASSCSNGGVCRENVIGTTRHAYCYCSAGYNGAKCENRYFTCPGVGRYADPIMFNQGKYFDCTNVGGTIRIEQKSCPRGLRYNANRDRCTY